MRIQTKSDKADVVNCMCKLVLVADQEKVDTELVVEEAVSDCRSFVIQNCTFDIGIGESSPCLATSVYQFWLRISKY